MGNGKNPHSRHPGSIVSLTYQLNENGCDTGSHTFNTRADYCAGLNDETLNNGCALDLRQQLIQQNCGVADPAPAPTRIDVGVTEVAPKKAALPSELNVKAKISAPLTLKILEEDPTILITLDGKFKIESISPELKSSLKLGRASSFGSTTFKIVAPDASDCSLAAHQLSDPDNAGMFGMTLIGSGKDCLTVFSEIKQNGVTIELKDVPISNWAETQIISKVILRITK